VGENPNHGYTNFDNFMWSMLTTFQLITLDYWENVYNMVSGCWGRALIGSQPRGPHAVGYVAYIPHVSHLSS
jgi:hypothetical protein